MTYSHHIIDLSDFTNAMSMNICHAVFVTVILPSTRESAELLSFHYWLILTVAKELGVVIMSVHRSTGPINS